MSVAVAVAEPAERPWATAGVVMLGLIMSIIDASIVNVALPHMMGTLGADVSSVSWVVTGYILANVVVIPLAAWLASLVGRSRLYFWAVVLFTVSSVACGLAPNLTLLIVARVFQGLAAGVMMPTGQSILYESFPPEKRGMSMAFFGLGVMAGPAIGPTLGGYITDMYGWPWIFFINLPIGVVAAVLVPMFLRDPSYLRRRTGGGDLFGILLLALGVGTAQYVLEKGDAAGWFEADWVVWATVSALLLLVGFVIWEREHLDPAVDLGVFAEPTFRAATLVSTIIGVGLMGGMFVLPLFMQQMMGLTATQSGFVLLPGAIATAATMPIAGRLADRTDARLLIAVGMSIFAYGMWLMSQVTPNAGTDALFWPQVCRGIGMGFTWVPLSTVSISRMPRERIAQATGLFNLTRQLGGGVGIAWLASRLQHSRAGHQAHLVGWVDPYSEVARQQIGGIRAGLMARGFDPASAASAAALSAWGRVARAAAELAFRDVFVLIVALFVGTLPLLLFIRRPTGKAAAVEIAHAE